MTSQYASVWERQTAEPHPDLEPFVDRSAQLAEALEIEMIRARRYQRPLSLVAIDAIAPPQMPDVAAGWAHLAARMRICAPLILRAPDFWGVLEELGCVIVLPETDEIGARGAVQRLVKTEPFQNLLTEFAPCGLSLGAAPFHEDLASARAFLQAARAAPVWSSEEAAKGRETAFAIGL